MGVIVDGVSLSLLVTLSTSRALNEVDGAVGDVLGLVVLLPCGFASLSTTTALPASASSEACQ